MFIWAFKTYSIVGFHGSLEGNINWKRQENPIKIHKIKVQKIVISINLSLASDQPTNPTSICMCTGLAVGIEPWYWRLFLLRKVSYSPHVMEV
jgi:hypothetical protein